MNISIQNFQEISEWETGTDGYWPGTRQDSLWVVGTERCWQNRFNANFSHASQADRRDCHRKRHGSSKRSEKDSPNDRALAQDFIGVAKVTGLKIKGGD